MKKVILGIFAAIILFTAFESKAQMRWGVTAGATITDLKWSQKTFMTPGADAPYLFTVDQEVGYQAGIFGEYTIPGIGFCIDLGLQYTQRGATMHMGDFKVWSSEGYGIERSYLHYIDIPVHLRFKYQRMNGFERKLAPFVFGGPTFSILAGHSDIDAFDYKSVIVNLEAGFGVELFRDYQISASYGWDVTNAIQAKKLDNFKAKSRTWKIAATYFF